MILMTNPIYNIDFTSHPAKGAVTLDLTNKPIILEIVFNTGEIIRLSNYVKLITCREYLKSRKVKGTTHSGAITIPTALQNGGSIP